jgi:hypothetical protein
MGFSFKKVFVAEAQASNRHTKNPSKESEDYGEAGQSAEQVQVVGQESLCGKMIPLSSVNMRN